MDEQIERDDSQFGGAHVRSAAIDDVKWAEREITLIAVPYNEEAVVPDWRPRADREVFIPGSFSGIEVRTQYITLNRDHSMERPIGVARHLDTKDTKGLIARFKVSETTLGDESLQLAADGVLRASIAFTARSQNMEIKDGVMRFHKAFLRHVALTPEPAYEGAGIINVRTGDLISQDIDTPNLNAAAAILREIQAAIR